ncbi:MAG: hypothetical protein MUO81_08760 [Thermoplasmata archaeon]|nr:hypothetical protein [Thermoplasmata archaeon]
MEFRGIDHGIIKRFTYTRNDEPSARYKMRHDPFRIAASIRNPSIKASIQTAYGILEYCRTSYGNSRARKSIRSTERFVTEVGRGTRIHPTAYVAPKGVRIGGECRIGPRAVVMGGSFIDDQVTIGPRSIVGSEGYVCKRCLTKVIPVVHVGGVQIRKRARIGGNCCIDKAVDSSNTVIGEETVLGDFIHVAHNARIGSRCWIDSNSMIAGYVKMGDEITIEANASISNRVEIGEHAAVLSGSVVTKNVDANQVVSGNFAVDRRKHEAYLAGRS